MSSFKLPTGISFADSKSEEILSPALTTTSASNNDQQQTGSIIITKGPTITQIPISFIAALVGNLALVKQLVRKSSSSTTPMTASDGRTIAEFAARGNQVSVLEYLVSEFGKESVDVPNTSGGGATPISVAVQYGHIETVKFLVEKGDVKVDRVFSGNRTLLHLGVRKDRVEVVKYLIGLNKIDKDAKMEVISGNPAVTAVSSKKEDDSSTEQQNKKKTEDTTTNDEIAGEGNIFALACAECSVEMVSMLIKERAHVQNLLEATGTSKQIIERICHSNKDGSPLSQQEDEQQQQKQEQKEQDSSSQHLKQEKMIFKKFSGFPVMPMSSSPSSTTSSSAAASISSTTKRLEAITKQKETSTYILHLEKKRDLVQSPLHIACCQGNLPVVRFLIEKTQFDCDKNARVCGATPLYLAVRFNKLEVVKYLVSEARVEIDKTSGEGAGSSNTQDSSNFSTPLFAACFYNFHEIAKILMSHNAASSIAYKGATPFIGAIANEATQCVLLLIEVKGDTSSGYKGDSPLTFAKNEGKTAIAKILTENNIQ